MKVLDFGPAKALDPSAGTNPDLMNSPTITSPATQMGMILGTAAYMAPEQAKGRAVDKRADIPLVQSQFDDAAGALSPDEKWLAHSSDQTGRREAYVRSLTGDTGRWQISTPGGWAPAWREGQATSALLCAHARRAVHSSCDCCDI